MIDIISDAVKSDELKWLANGSEFLVEQNNLESNSSSKAKTYTSFNCSQKSLPEFANNPIDVMPGITIARLAPGQVKVLFSFLGIVPILILAILSLNKSLKIGFLKVRS